MVKTPLQLYLSSTEPYDVFFISAFDNSLIFVAPTFKTFFCIKCYLALTNGGNSREKEKARKTKNPKEKRSYKTKKEG